ncbi:hypothetical protein Tco_0146229 [Tanacetum coccineum]
MDFALVLVVAHSRSALRCLCLAFLARFGATLASLSTNASLNLSAIGNSIEFKEGEVILSLDPRTTQVFGSIYSMIKSSKAIPVQNNMKDKRHEAATSAGAGVSSSRSCMKRIREYATPQIHRSIYSTKIMNRIFPLKAPPQKEYQKANDKPTCMSKDYLAF